MATIDSRPFALRDGRAAIIRSLRPDDAAALIALMHTASQETRFLTYEPGEFSYTMEAERELVQKRVEDPHGLWIGAEVDGQIAGTCQVGRLSGKRRLRHRASLGIALKRAYWRQGIGRQLMEIAIGWCREMGYLQLELEVNADNAPAIALYKSLGFAITGTHPREMGYPDGTFADGYIMWLPLDQ